MPSRERNWTAPTGAEEMPEIKTRKEMGWDGMRLWKMCRGQSALEVRVWRNIVFGSVLLAIGVAGCGSDAGSDIDGEPNLRRACELVEEALGDIRLNDNAAFQAVLEGEETRGMLEDAFHAALTGVSEGESSFPVAELLHRALSLRDMRAAADVAVPVRGICLARREAGL